MDESHTPAPGESGSPDSPESRSGPTEPVDRVIGPYRLIEPVGEGGMGEVWLAQQNEPIRRRVALKLIKAGMDTRHVLARFETERQALAVMDHPNVARVLDAGVTERGLPYFVMEYVEGVSITEFCDRHALTIRDRVALFVDVCEAIQHAHQKGIIHRDIKPTNVIVAMSPDGTPVAKVIDFGVAKATGDLDTEETVFTQHGSLVGTLEYMSPEQADRGTVDIDTRTDIYSLGVLLYVLLTGELPFDSKQLRAAGFAEAHRIILEQEPVSPSRRVATLDDVDERARARGTIGVDLRRGLRGDLDAIVVKALAKDRRRRYDSASQLAADLRHHLRSEPVEARPPSAMYQLQRLVARNRLAFTFAATVVVMLAILAVTMSFQARRIAQARDRANREAATSARVAEFLADMLASFDPEDLGRGLASDLRRRIEDAAGVRTGDEAVGVEASVTFDHLMAGVNATDAGLRMIDLHLLSPASRAVAEQFTEDPAIAARLDRTIGRAYQRLGLYEEAEASLRRSLEALTRDRGADDPDVLVVRNSIARLLSWRGRYAESEALHRELLGPLERSLGPEHAATLSCKYGLAVACQLQGRLDEAESLFRETLASRRTVLGRTHQDTIQTQVDLASVLVAQGELVEAEELHREALDVRRRLLGDEDPFTLWSMAALASTYRRAGQLDEAERLFTDALETRRRLLGDEHSFTLWSMAALANTYVDQGRYDVAEPLHRDVLEARRRVLGPTHPLTLSSQVDVATCCRLQGRREDAARLLEKTLEAQQATLGADHPNTIDTARQLKQLK